MLIAVKEWADWTKFIKIKGIKTFTLNIVIICTVCAVHCT